MGAWCIITVCSASAFTVDTQAILQRESGFLGEEGAQASRITYAMERKFSCYSFQNTKVFLAR